MVFFGYDPPPPLVLVPTLVKAFWFFFFRVAPCSPFGIGWTIPHRSQDIVEDTRGLLFLRNSRRSF